MYRIGFPFWRTLGSAGVTLKLRVDVLHDKEANVFVATSNDLRGLVCEAETLDELVKEVTSSVGELLDHQLHSSHAPRPVTDLRLLGA
ncbi:protein of unknown function [Nitrosospira sp. Nl5]|uniref:DUF1902 domain-containing protein n=1 Tax=Nitrosospira sp. Nl5 TaxID=200120 RepID=UPI000881EA2E|nr:DUF1902 domain-containing protein [Nitrosospira sp. Nl5]SCX92014.1 protein of unknown function [Nitrosospira sp. Nl5]